MRRRKRAAYRALLWLLLLALLALAVAAGLHLWQIARDKTSAERLLQEMRTTARANDMGSALPASASGANAGASSGTPAAEPSAPLSEHLCPVDFAALRAQYPDVVAWLTGCGGAIDTPIVQGTDNQYYLRHLPDGTRNSMGAAFLDSANDGGFSDDQSFLFGHHMDAGGGVFSPLLEYRSADYWRENPAFILHTPEGCYSAEVFAAFVVGARAYPYLREFASADEMQAFVDAVCGQSEIFSSTHPVPGDRVLTLCTCTSKTDDLRYVVCTRLSPLARAGTE